MKSLITKIFIRLINIYSYQKRKFRRKIVSLKNIYFVNYFRYSSLPYISGDTIRNFSDHIFDETTSFQPEMVNHNDLVFLKTDLIEVFFKYIHPQILNRYILITHNSDRNIYLDDLKFIDDKIISPAPRS